MKIQDKRKIKNLIYHIIDNGKITTTVSVAKSVKPKIERLITRAKSDTVANRRYVAKTVAPEGVSKLFSVIGPANKDRNGGYTRLLRLDQPRQGDGAELCILEIIDV